MTNARDRCGSSVALEAISNRIYLTRVEVTSVHCTNLVQQKGILIVWDSNERILVDVRYVDYLDSTTTDTRNTSQNHP